MGILTNIYTWAAANATAVAQLQTTAGAGSLLVNGSLSTGTGGAQRAVFGNVSRTVSLSSANDLHLVNVTITGTYQGAVVSSTIAGPNVTPVYTTQLYDTVTAISVSGAVTALSLGSGTTGNTWWNVFDYYRPYPSMSVQVVVTGTINYSFQTTNDDVAVVAAPFVNTGLVLPQPGNAQAYQTVMSSATASAFAYFSYPVQYCNVIINSATNGTLVAKIIQQGIR